MKKIRVITGLLLAILAYESAFAGTIYLGPTLLLQTITSVNSNYRGLRPSLAMGYSGQIDFYYLAAEVFASTAALSLTSSHSDEGNSLRIAQDFGASFIPGLLLSEGVISYLRLGIVSSKFRAPSTTKTGGQVGIGLQANLSTAWSLRGEYIYTAYSNVEDMGSPQVDTFGLGLIYKFDGLA